MKLFTSSPAFTLAEVLITLGIIGVVAALTIPALMNSTGNAEYVSAYKKTLSVLNRSEERRVGKECVRMCVDLGGRRIIQAEDGIRDD